MGVRVGEGVCKFANPERTNLPLLGGASESASYLDLWSHEGSIQPDLDIGPLATTGVARLITGCAGIPDSPSNVGYRRPRLGLLAVESRIVV